LVRAQATTQPLLFDTFAATPDGCAVRRAWCTQEAAQSLLRRASSTPPPPAEARFVNSIGARGRDTCYLSLSSIRVQRQSGDLVIGRLAPSCSGGTVTFELLACLGKHAASPPCQATREATKRFCKFFATPVHTGAAVPARKLLVLPRSCSGILLCAHSAGGRAELRSCRTPPYRRDRAGRSRRRSRPRQPAVTWPRLSFREWPEKVRAADSICVVRRKAKASTLIWRPSLLAAGIAILSDDWWQRSDDLTLNLFLERRNARSSARP